MNDRISAYESDAEEIEKVLFYEENVTDSERANALVALARIVAHLQTETRSLYRELQKQQKEKEIAELVE
jgi:hypothetical protein